MEYKVSGNKYGLHGDGWAFWYTTEREQEGKTKTLVYILLLLLLILGLYINLISHLTPSPGPVFGSKDEFTGLGVFFDTYANGRQRYTFPYISAMIGDGKTKYDHDNDGNANSIGGCPCDFRGLVEPNTTKVKITFVKNQFLRVSKGGGSEKQLYTFVFAAQFNNTTPYYNHNYWGVRNNDITFLFATQLNNTAPYFNHNYSTSTIINL